MVQVGKPLPAGVRKLPLALSSGALTHLSNDGWLVLYFYPKDNTPGCTTQGRDFNRLLPIFKQLGAGVLGVSRDSLKSHQNFCAKQGFEFDLVSDEEGRLCHAFDVIKPKKLYGREYMGIQRSTFLIDPTGKVHAVWRGVKVPGHAQAVLDTLKSAQAQ